MHLVVIDPAMRIAEVECFNRMALTSPVPATYHLPAMFGMQSLEGEDMQSAAGIVILGSSSSINDQLPWQAALQSWLMPHLERGVPTLGICFGHQMLAYMFGGRIGFVFPDQTKHKGFREMRVATSRLGPACKGEVTVSHCETVVSLPKSMRVIAASDAIEIDGMQHETLPIVTFQPHPEATLEFLESHGIEGGTQQRLAFGHQLVGRFLRLLKSS